MYTTDLKGAPGFLSVSRRGFTTERALIRIIVVCTRSLWDIIFDRKKLLLEERGRSGDGDSGAMPARRGTGGSVVEGGPVYTYQMQSAWGKRGPVKSSLLANPTRSLKGMPGLKVRNDDDQSMPGNENLMDRSGWKRRRSNRRSC